MAEFNDAKEYVENHNVTGTPLQGAQGTAPADRGGMVQYGQDANASALQQAGLLDNTLFRKVTEFRVRKYPFYTAMFTKATQMAWKGHKEAEYPEVGDIKVEARTIAGIAANTTNNQVTFTSTELSANDMAIFRPKFSIIVQESTALGQDEDGNSEHLVLYIKERSSSGIVCEALNAPGGKCPAIPSGSLLVLGAPMLAEEEVEVDPINVIPTMKNAYLQKKSYAVAITDFFTEAAKEIDWEKDRIKRQALDTYKKLYTTSALFGTKKKWYKQTENGMRTCYSSEGLINQIRMAFQLPNGKWTKGALIGIAKMLFTAYTDAEEIEVFCGSDAIEGLLNIDWGTGTNQITYLADADYNIDIATFKCTFGTLHFVHEISLTQNHLEKAAIAVPMKDAIRLYRDNGSTKKADGNKGETGRVEELTKEFFVQDDCFVCNALNSMIIGPAEIFNNQYTSGVKETYKAVETLPTTGMSSGDIVYLTKAAGNDTPGLYKYNGTAWKSYVRDETRA